MWIEIDLSAIYNNLLEIKRLAGNRRIISVVKDDAYGHTAKEVVKKIDKVTDFFGVASVSEARQLKELTNKSFIVFGGVFDGEFKYLDRQIIPVVYDFESLERLKNFGKGVLINIEIDTGMTRTGFLPDEISRLIDFLKKAKNIKVQGVMSHFASADCNKSFTNFQYRVFKNAVKKFINSGINPEIVHIANSAGIFYKNNDLINAVRPGIMLYGGYPNRDLRKKIKLIPAMTFKTKIISVKKVSAGTYISYGGTYRTEKDSIIATLSVGYGDGYLRSLSNKGLVYVKDRGIARVCGRVCMDMLMIDVTDLKGVKKGDEVVLWGGDIEEVHPDNIAELAGTISYELFCIVTKRVKRFFKE
ncbi:MAG: alanine racemase [Proteobacteria bacterium]|nr:alanine racemase [Pseudomonadota bacterium]